MTYPELKGIFQKLKQDHPGEDLTAHIIFTEDSFDRPYPLLSRTYTFDSDNKAFWPDMGGYSIFGYCLDGTDQGIRLDGYMAEEGNPGGWKVEDCYILERMRDAMAISRATRTEQEDGTVRYVFGGTRILAREVRNGHGWIDLEPVAGNQVSCGKRTKLPIDRVHGYCMLLERHVNDCRQENGIGTEKPQETENISTDGQEENT